jgi:hypothetical protein
MAWSKMDFIVGQYGWKSELVNKLLELSLKLNI